MIDRMKSEISDVAHAYNAIAEECDRISRIELFGSYADGIATASSDIDLLVGFRSSAVSPFPLAKVLDEMESRIGSKVDIVQEPLPADSLLRISKVVPIYAG